MNPWQGMKREAVLDIYRFAVRRLETEEQLNPGQVERDIYHLRWVLKQSMRRDGPGDLVELSEQPELCGGIFREPGGVSHGHASRSRAAFEHFLKLILGADLAVQRLEAIEQHLWPRRITGWHQADHVVGGRRTRKKRRRLLFAQDLLAITEKAAEGKSGEQALRDRCLMTLYCWSGLETGEIVNLTWDQVSWEGDRRPDDPFGGWVRCSRDGRELKLPLHRRAADPLGLLYHMIKRITDRKPEGRVFRGLRAPYEPLGYRRVKEIFDEALAKAGLPDASPRDLRAAFAHTLMTTHGYTVPDLVKILGYGLAESVQDLLRNHQAHELRRKAEKSGKLFGDAAGEVDACREPDIAPDGLAQPSLFE